MVTTLLLFYEMKTSYYAIANAIGGITISRYPPVAWKSLHYPDLAPNAAAAQWLQAEAVRHWRLQQNLSAAAGQIRSLQKPCHNAAHPSTLVICRHSGVRLGGEVGPCISITCQDEVIFG